MKFMRISVDDVCKWTEAGSSGERLPPHSSTPPEAAVLLLSGRRGRQGGLRRRGPGPAPGPQTPEKRAQARSDGRLSG